MAEKPKTEIEPEELPLNRAERRRLAKKKRGPTAPETRGSANPDALGASRDQQRMTRRLR